MRESAFQREMLCKRRLFERAGFAVDDVRCASGPGPWSPPEEATGYGVVFVRSGCFRRRLDGVDSLVDPTTVYFEAPGQEQQVAHPHGGGDACTAVVLAPEVLASLFGGDPALPARPVYTTPAADLTHRR